MIATKNPMSLSPTKLKAIWQQISPADWLSLLQEYHPNNRWTLMGSTIKGMCVKHDDKSPSMFVDLEKGRVRCYGGGCGYYKWDPIRFTADVTKSSYSTALTKLRKRFGIKLPKTFHQNVQQIEDNAKLKRVLQHVMNLELRDILRDPDNPKFTYAKKAGLVSWLRKRGFPEGSVHHWPVGVFMPRDRLHERLGEKEETKEFQDAAFKYLKGQLAVPGGPMIHEGSLAFFYYTAPDVVGRIRIRHPSSKDKVIIAIPDEVSDEVGVFGLNTFPHLLNDLDKYPLYVVEGEMDAMSVFSRCLDGGFDMCVVATGGSMENELDPLKEFGFAEAYLVPDNDAEGIGWASNLLSHNDLPSRIFRWSEKDEKGKVKDVDEAIRSYGFDDVYGRLSDELNLPRNNEWVADQLEAELTTVDSEDARARTKCASKWGGVIRNDAERNSYLNYVEANYSLDKESVLQDLTSDEDTPVAFVRRLKRKLLDDVYVFLTEKQVGATGSSTIAIAWSKTKRVLRRLPLNSKPALNAALSADIGSLSEFVTQEIGEPTHINVVVSAKGTPIPVSPSKKSQLVLDSFHEAISNIAKEMSHSNWLTELGQGIHWIDDFEDGKPAVLIANGTKFFKGMIHDDGSIRFEEVNSPIVGKFFFTIESKQWSKHIQSVKDIEDGMNYNLKELYEKVLRIFRESWRFEDHELEAQFLAADVLYTPVFSVFNHINMVDVTGESHSGKTTLLQVIGGTEFPDIRLCESAVLLDDFTEASVRQRMNGVGLRLMLDEFEDADYSGSNRPDKRARAVRNIHEMIRSMTSGTSEVIRGTASGEHQTFRLHFPVTISGIYTMREARDLNRYVHIRTTVMTGFRDPVEVIRETHTKEELADIQRGVTLGLLARIPKVLKAREDIRKEFSTNSSLPQDMLTRLKDNFLPVTTIMKMAGQDYMTFLSGFSEIKMEELREQGGTTRESESIWDNLLHATITMGAHSPDADVLNGVSLGRTLSSFESRSLLNSADIGVYYMEEHNWLIVFWQKAIHGILRNTNKYRGVLYPGRLKSLADADPRVVTKEKLSRNPELLSEIRQLAGGSIRISIDQLSVIDLNDTLILSKHDEDSEAEDTGPRHRMLSDIPSSGETGNIRKIARGDFEV